jgi:hypothetical protein
MGVEKESSDDVVVAIYTRVVELKGGSERGLEEILMTIRVAAAARTPTPAISHPRNPPFRVFYDDDDPNRVLREEQVAPGEAEQGPKDGLMGAGFAEGALTRLLA